jgi:hypothetical protein
VALTGLTALSAEAIKVVPQFRRVRRAKTPGRVVGTMAGGLLMCLKDTPSQ